MIRAMLWKEWREQRTVALAVLSFGAAALYLTAQLADPLTGGNPWEGGGPRELMAVALAYLAGAVAGAILLADEKEVGTMEFLDTLPCRRRALWTGKALAGALLAVGQSALIALVAIAVGSFDERLGPLPYALVVLLVGVMAFAWGAFGGALARSTLGAVFQGSLASFGAGLALVVPFVIVFGPRGFTRPIGLPLFTYYGCWVGAGLLGSALLFTRLDRRRATARRRSNVAAAAIDRSSMRKPWLAGLRALTWLTARQAVFVTLASLAAAVLVGAVMLAPDAHPLFIWPGATLALGVLAGVTTVGEEQAREVARFWAERRLPLGRLWLVKTGFHFALAAAGALVIGVFVYALSPQVPFRSQLTVQLRTEFGRFLMIGLVYGFVVGHLAGMVFRKTVVAGLVATVGAVTLTGLVLPAVVGGGAAAWQVWGPAAVLIGTARLLLYPWATGRVASRGPVVRAVGGAVAAVAVLGAGIGYRVAEVPAAPDRLAESGFVASLPTFEANDVGRQVKAVATQYRTAATEAQDVYPSRRPAPAPGARRFAPTPEGIDPLARFARAGWTPEAAALLDRWLDRVFAIDWPRGLEDVADRPPGVYEDPRDLDYSNPGDAYHNLRDMTAALRARGLQRQAAGDPEAFPRLLRGGLAAARTARNRAGLQAVDVAHECEFVLLTGLTEWADKLAGRPDLLRQVLATLDRHEADMPAGSADAFWAEQILLRNTMDRVGSWLPRVLDPRPDRLEGPDDRAEAEGNLVAFAWHVPWERARRDRLLRFETGRRVDPGWLSAIHQPNRWRMAFDRTDDLDAADRRSATLRRLARLRTALRLYELEHGGPAPDVAALVPAYLSAVPTDPYTGRPFGYRVSAGEVIAGGSILVERTDYLALGVVACLGPPTAALNAMWVGSQIRERAVTHATPSLNTPVVLNHFVPAGYGVVWSAGPDGRDDGGHRTGPRGTPVAPGDDWVVLVPPPRRPRE